MKTSTQLLLVIIAGILLVSYAIYSKFNQHQEIQAETVYPLANASISSSTMDSSSNTTTDTQTLGSDSALGVISGKVILINTNAENITFINLKDANTGETISYMTNLEKKSLHINRGDIIQTSKNLEKSSNGRYYLISSSVDYQVLQKNTAEAVIPDKKLSIESITTDLQGIDVTTSGKVLGLRTSSKGHNFFTLSDGTHQIKAVMFAAEASDLIARQKVLEQAFQNNENINIKGKVSVYQGELEIIISKLWN